MDEVAIAYLLGGFDVDFGRSMIRFYPNKSMNISIEFDIDKKRIGVGINILHFKPKEFDNIFEHIRKTVGVTPPKQRKLSFSEYDFKYSQKNCERIVKMIKEVLIYFDGAET